MNISLTVKKLGVGKETKIGVLAFQKVAKPGNIGKKVQWQVVLII